jgi:hypothetical protein
LKDLAIHFRPILLTLVWASGLISHSIHAQKSDVGNWLIYFGNQAINKNWNWWNEVQYRNYDLVGDLQQFIVRTGLGYNLTENNNNLLFGYAFIHSQAYVINSDLKSKTNEHRLYQQFVTRQQFGRFFLQHRYRLEERFLPDAFRLRFRYLLGINYPLNNPTMVKNTVYLSFYNELFVNARSPLYDRNRLYGAVGFVFSRFLRAEIGMMAQTLEKTNRNQLQLVFFNSLPIDRN